MENGILYIDKPKGITSFDVIRILRKKIGRKKMGHAGTLDPLATGLLIVAVGKATKSLSDFVGLSKEYVAEIKFGIKTDTGDVEGRTLYVSKEKISFSKKEVEKALKSLVGEIVLKVPLYSAVKHKGKPLYVYAREGGEVEVPERVMNVISAKLLSFESDVATVHFHVKSGVYIRALAEALGERLGTYATIQNLRRTAIGPYKVEDAKMLL
jgi:tRNA pseudouridine55 synthase